MALRSNSPVFIEIHAYNQMIILRIGDFVGAEAMHAELALRLFLFSFDRTVAILRNCYLFLFTKLCETVI